MVGSGCNKKAQLTHEDSKALPNREQAEVGTILGDRSPEKPKRFSCEKQFRANPATEPTKTTGCVGWMSLAFLESKYMT